MYLKKVYIYIHICVFENVVYPQDSYFSHDNDNEPNEPLNLGVSYVQTNQIFVGFIYWISTRNKSTFQEWLGKNC